MTDLRTDPAQAAAEALTEATDASFRAAELTRELGRLEADRHGMKDAAIRRLMLPPAEGEKGLARTPAEAIVNTDPAYRDYLLHIADRQAKLDETRDTIRTAHLRARLAVALLEQGVAA